MKHYFAAGNYYGSASSTGFENTWFVRAFKSMEARDRWVLDTDRIDRRTVLKRDITEYIDAPKPFTGEYLAIYDTTGSGELDVTVVSGHDPYEVRRLYPR